jgi:hypothetical protein
MRRWMYSPSGAPCMNLTLARSSSQAIPTTDATAYDGTQGPIQQQDDQKGEIGDVHCDENGVFKSVELDKITGKVCL